MNDVRLEAVRKSYGPHEVVKGVDLAVESGEFIVFVGPSGCGKSTLLRMVTGLETITSGKLFINGRDVTHLPPGEREIAMVFQTYALYPHMTVDENMAFGLRMNGVPRKDVAQRVAEAARILQIELLLSASQSSFPAASASAWRSAAPSCASPRCSSSMSRFPISTPSCGSRCASRSPGCIAEIGATMIYVTHDQVEAMTLADRIVVLNQGVAEQIGSPLSLYEKPVNRFVAGFLGQPRMNFIEGRVVDMDGGRAQLSLSGGNRIIFPRLETRASEGQPTASSERGATQHRRAHTWLA